MYYECHISIGLHPTSAKELIECLNGWSFSCIQGDPVLGKGVYEYATRHAPGSTDLGKVIQHMNDTAHILKGQGFPVIRQKVEIVVYDTVKESHT